LLAGLSIGGEARLAADGGEQQARMQGIS
jgi:hypothetical protein